MFFKECKIVFVNNKKKSLKMMLNTILRKLPSPHGEFSVMCFQNLYKVIMLIKSKHTTLVKFDKYYASFFENVLVYTENN